jgi:thioredoxin-like negative regulator of GroEL
MMAPPLERAARTRPRTAAPRSNVDKQPQLAAAFQVQAIPTLLAVV